MNSNKIKNSPLSSNTQLLNDEITQHTSIYNLKLLLYYIFSFSSFQERKLLLGYIRAIR